MTRLKSIDAPGEDHSPQGYPVRAIRVDGDCMLPYLMDGDIALALPPDAVIDGDTVTATVDLMHHVCKVIRLPVTGDSYLEPINGEGIIPEPRFVVTGVIRHKITQLRRK